MLRRIENTNIYVASEEYDKYNPATIPASLILAIVLLGMGLKLDLFIK
jgi:hypothetical protein